MDSVPILALETAQMLENGAEAEAVDGETLNSNNPQTTVAGGSSQRNQEILVGDKAAERVEDGGNNQLSLEIPDGAKEVAQAEDGDNRRQTATQAGANNPQTAMQGGTSLNNPLNSTAGVVTTTPKVAGAETAETDGDLSLIILSIHKY